ncbi:hypothetical protein BJX76DRAFT_132329 [Aspergillus varians]
MKRSYVGVPIEMTHNWGRPPLSCLPCRQKKRRCDRRQPCWNCSQRGISCVYPDNSHVGGVQTAEPLPLPLDLNNGGPNHTVLDPASSSARTDTRNVEMMDRIRKLESAVFNQSVRESEPGEGIFIDANTMDNPVFRFTSFNSHFSPTEPQAAEADEASQHLPPLPEARNLFNHFAVTLHPTIGILHIPSTQSLIEQAYQTLNAGSAPDRATSMLLFGVFAGSALSATPSLLQALNATHPQATAAYKAYLRISLSMIDSPQPLPPSTTALVAMALLCQFVNNDGGYSVDGHLMRARCYCMARSLDIHRIDTPKRREERNLNGYNFVELELQRRVWWSLVASDWLSSFSGGIQERAYSYHPKHMCVDYPANVDDNNLCATGIRDIQPPSVPTLTSYLIYRANLSRLCREVVDSMPPISQDHEPCYDTILALDERFQEFFADLPLCYRLDPESIEQSRPLSVDRPYIEWQRTTAHISIHTRLCRLHRPYHLKGMTDPKYAYSRQVCVRSAQVVLDLRRSMDESHLPVGLRPARFWVIVHHVSLAALTLATDVSFDVTAPDAEARRAKVLAAYETLEKSTEEPCEFREVIKKNLQTLMATLNKRQSSHDISTSNQPQNISHRSSIAVGSEPPHGLVQEGTSEQGLAGGSTPWDDDWERLWSEFLEVAPDLDFSQWDQLLDGDIRSFQ